MEENAVEPTYSTVSGISGRYSAAQFANAPSSMRMTDAGIFSFFRALQLVKQYAGMVVMPSGSVSSVMPLQLANA